MKLKKGDTIEDLKLPSVDGTTFSLETIKGKKAMISFYRYSSCPFCHLRINEIINKNEDLTVILMTSLKIQRNMMEKSQFCVMTIVFILINMKYKTVS